jgi:hypothetical protein
MIYARGIRRGNIHRLILGACNYSATVVTHERILMSTTIIIEHAGGIIVFHNP